MIIVKKELDATDKKIIKKSAEGLTAKEIGRDLLITHRAVEARIREMKKYYSCKSLVHLVQKLLKLQ